MEHYVTLLDSLFLPQGIALHASMQRHLRGYTLWVLCVDSEAYRILNLLNLANVRILDLGKIETKELLSIKHKRSKAEYCWTLTPFAPRFVFEAESSIDRVTYIDADISFLSPPNKIFEELDHSKKEVLITDHAYDPYYDQSPVSGPFCVQFIIFNRVGGELVRKWWEERCIEWCYNRYEDGKLGDQRYLDHWPNQFPRLVHVMQNKELALAPWNAARFPFGSAVFYHFHGLRLISGTAVNAGGYSIPYPVLEYVYRPYLSDLKNALITLELIGYKIRPQAVRQNFLKKIGKIFFRLKRYLYSVTCTELKL